MDRKIVFLFATLFDMFASDTMIIYPDKFKQLIRENKMFPNMQAKLNLTPECAENSTLWCNPYNYPELQINQLLQENKIIKQLLDKDKDQVVQVQRPSAAAVDDGFENICDEDTEYIHPQAAKNRDGEFQFIVNNPRFYPEYRQLVKVTTCTWPEQECGHGDVFSSFSTSCKQEYSDHKLVALSKTGEELVVDTFSFPSCCVCKVHRRSLTEL